MGDLEAFREAVEPGGIVVGEALWRRRPPQRLAQQGLGADDAADVLRLPGRA
jgi:hypothetical protein